MGSTSPPTHGMSPEYSSSPLNENGVVELQQLLERDSTLEDSEEAGSPGIAPLQDSAGGIGVNRRLFISHFLSTWNSRVFEFGAVLFIAKTFPGTLLPVSVYAVVRSASAIALSPMVGRYIDVSDRLKVVRSSIGKPIRKSHEVICISDYALRYQWASGCQWQYPVLYSGHCWCSKISRRRSGYCYWSFWLS
jgi:Ferroportin1 (FPN1)